MVLREITTFAEQKHSLLGDVALHYYCVTIKFKSMENNIQKEDLLALVKSKIYTIRGQKVMLDFDIANCDIKTCRETRKTQIKNVFEEGEIRQETTVAKFATVVNRGIQLLQKLQLLLLLME